MSAALEPVLGYGPIVAADDELGICITLNGSYLNVWTLQRASGAKPWDPYPAMEWKNVDLEALDVEGGMYGLTAADAWDRGKELLERLRRGDPDEGE